MNSSLQRLADKLQRWTVRAGDALLATRPFEQLDVTSAPALTVTSDDGSVRNLAVAETLLAVGARGVFAVSPDLLGQPGMMTLDDVHRLHKAGHEIAFHGADDTPFNRLGGGATLADTCRAALRRMESDGLTPSVVMYPHGIHSRGIRQAVATVFSAGFSTTFGINKGRVCRYAIRRMPFGAYADPRQFNELWYSDVIKRAKDQGAWIVLMLHPGADEHADANSERLARIVRVAQERSIAVRTASEQLLRVSEPHRSPKAMTAVASK